MEHELYMVEGDVFASAHTLPFEHVEPYVRDEITREEAIRRVMLEIREG